MFVDELPVDTVTQQSLKGNFIQTFKRADQKVEQTQTSTKTFCSFEY
jgi:hypothetical protein